MSPAPTISVNGNRQTMHPSFYLLPQGSGASVNDTSMAFNTSSPLIHISSPTRTRPVLRWAVYVSVTQNRSFALLCSCDRPVCLLLAYLINKCHMVTLSPHCYPTPLFTLSSCLPLLVSHWVTYDLFLLYTVVKYNHYQVYLLMFKTVSGLCPAVVVVLWLAESY